MKTISSLAVTIALTLSCAASNAEPIKLKFALANSDRSSTFADFVKPFAEAVKADAGGSLEIEIYSSGALGRGQPRQVELVIDGTADMAFIVPGQSPDRFTDQAIIELPGLYRNGPEATLVYTGLTEAGVLSGYDDLFVIAAVASSPWGINSRKPLASLADLQGQKIRTNNRIESTVLESLGAVPVVIAADKALDAITGGAVDGATMPPGILFEFGIGRVTSNHFLIPTNSAPLAVVMNRAKFDSLPEEAKAVLRKYSGAWMAKLWSGNVTRQDQEVIEKLRGDPRRTVAFPTPADVQTAERAYARVVAEWAAASERNRELLRVAQDKLAEIRAMQ